MNKIISGFNNEEVEKALEDNFLSLLPYNKNWLKASVCDKPNIFYSITDINSPLFNNVVNAKLKHDEIEFEIKEVLKIVKKRKVSILWWISPSTEPHNLGEYLIKNDFIKIGESPGLAIELDKVRFQKLENTELTIEIVNEQTKLLVWCNLVGKVFEMSETDISNYYDYMKNIDLERTTPYLGLLNNIPVATSLCHIGGGVAGIYSVSTLPEFRKQGIGEIMTLFALNEANNRKYRIGVLQSSEMSDKLYRTIGFNEICKMGQYLFAIE